jgi:hypothetical protein
MGTARQMGGNTGSLRFVPPKRSFARFLRFFFTMRRFPRSSAVIKTLWVLGLVAGSAIITRGSLDYFNDEELPAFVIEKLPLPMEELWLGALKLHVAAAAFAFPACLLLLSVAVMKKAPRFHRWLGRIAGTVILFALVPSGFYMSLWAKGGLVSTAGFILSGVIMAVAMVQGVRTARARQFVEHRRFALHVLAQMSVAVTSRVMLFAFDAVNYDAELAYLIALWVPVLGSVAAVELMTRNLSPFSRRNHDVPSLARSTVGLDPRFDAVRG